MSLTLVLSFLPLALLDSTLISQPDLPNRLKENMALTLYNPQTFYTRGNQEGAEVGYIDYPFAKVN